MIGFIYGSGFGKVSWCIDENESEELIGGILAGWFCNFIYLCWF